MWSVLSLRTQQGGTAKREGGKGGRHHGPYALRMIEEERRGEEE